ncbi:MAG TPA: hypothetical protein VL172_06715 [Kofleriaceae bacterium]|jgi:hypothetical protein|nr:hypothetical protein [Kofleriaceae bacterium]
MRFTGLLVTMMVAAAAHGEPAKPAPVPAPVPAPAAVTIDGPRVVAIASARTLPKGVTTASLRTLRKLLIAGKTDAAMVQWKAFLGKRAARFATVDVDALILWLMREAVLEQNRDLRQAADQMRYRNEQKQAIRRHLDELRATSGAAKAKVHGLSLPAYRRGAAAARVRAPRTLTRAQLDAEAVKWQASLDHLGETDQMATVDLQMAMDRQQKLLQTLSNISKMLYDTAQAVIGNMKG